MQIFCSSPRLANVVMVVLFAILFSGAIQHLREKSVTSEFLFISFFAMLGLISYIVYIYSLKVMINDEKFIYQTLFTKHAIDVKSIHAIQFEYSHLSVDTLFPFLHIYMNDHENEKRIEIPMMMFEKDIEEIQKLLVEKVECSRGL